MTHNQRDVGTQTVGASWHPDCRIVVLAPLNVVTREGESVCAYATLYSFKSQNINRLAQWDMNGGLMPVVRFRTDTARAVVACLSRRQIAHTVTSQ